MLPSSDDLRDRLSRRQGLGWRSVVGWWLASRAGLLLFVVLASYLLGVAAPLRQHSVLTWVQERVVWWDAFHFLRIADRGYLPPGLGCCDQAFFPGYPLLIRALTPAVGGATALAALAVSLLASSAAAVGLWRLARHESGALVARDAVLLLIVAPYGMFLTGAYTESSFLALAVVSWEAGRRGSWWLAGAFATGAALVRVNGLFLLAGLLVLYAGQLRHEPAGRGRRRRLDVLAMSGPVLAVAGYLVYLHVRTGSWNAWQEAQQQGWARRTAWPWQGLRAGWDAIVAAPTPDLVVSRWADLLTVVGGLALTLALLALRRWGEAVYVGPSVGVLVCSTMLTSAPRYALLWFPGYLLLARVMSHRGWGWLRPVLVATGIPCLLALSLAFSAHLWVA